MTSYGAEDGYRGRGYRGRGRGRSSSYRGRGGRGRGGSSDWYGHDDRGETAGGYHDDAVGSYTNNDSHGADRGSVPPPPPPVAINQSRKPAVQIVDEGWQYRDPEGAEHGPFMAAKMVKWIDQRYFSLGLEVRKVTRRGAGAWTELKYVLADIKREAALTIIPAATSPGLTVSVERGTAPDGRGAPPPPPPPHSPAFEEVSYARGGRGWRGGRGRGRGEDFDFDYGDQFGDRGRGGRGRRGGGRFAERGGRGGRFGERGGRGGRFDDRGGRGERGRGRGGRGGRGGGGGPSSEDTAAAAAVSKLFTGEVFLGTEQPMWRYIDPQGNMQGPFPAQDMESWYSEGYLANPALRVCGTERKVAPPNLPPPEFFIPLGALIYWVRRGHKFTPITVADVVAKKLPEELQKLKDGAEKVAVVPPKEKKESHSQDDDAEEEDTSNLAATMAKLAVTNVLVANGERIAVAEKEEKEKQGQAEEENEESEEEEESFVEATEEENHDDDDTGDEAAEQGKDEGGASVATQESSVGEN